MIHTTVVASLKPQHRSTCTFPHHDHHSLDLQPHPHSRSLRRLHYGRLRRLYCKQMGDRDECAKCFLARLLASLTLSLLMTTLEAFVNSVDQDQTAQNVQSDL